MTPPAWHLLPEHYEGSNLANNPGLYEIDDNLLLLYRTY
jgi:hypothetical protein